MNHSLSLSLSPYVYIYANLLGSFLSHSGPLYICAVFVRALLCRSNTFEPGCLLGNLSFDNVHGDVACHVASYMQRAVCGVQSSDHLVCNTCFLLHVWRKEHVWLLVTPEMVASCVTPTVWRCQTILLDKEGKFDSSTVDKETVPLKGIHGSPQSTAESGVLLYTCDFCIDPMQSPNC